MVTQMHAGLSNAWICTKGIDLGVFTINIQYFCSPVLIITDLFLLYWIIQ